MTQQKVVERSSIESWQATQLRLTAFPSEDFLITEVDWWSDLVGRPPDNEILQRLKGLKRQEGSFESGRLTLNLQSNKFDWLFEAVLDAESEQVDFPTLGSFPQSLHIFFRLMLRWFQSGAIPSIHRLAFGAKLVLLVDSQQAGYEKMTTYLHYVELDIEGSSDLLYQINRPRLAKIGIPNLKINRLSKWSVMKWYISRNEEESFTEIDKGSSCSLELDINTSQDFPGQLPPEKLSGIFQELIELGKEIVRKGDIK